MIWPLTPTGASKQERTMQIDIGIPASEREAIAAGLSKLLADH